MITPENGGIGPGGSVMKDVPLSRALDSIEFGTVVVNADGIITFYSSSYERFLGVRTPRSSDAT